MEMFAYIDARDVPLTRTQIPSVELVLPEGIHNRLQLVVRQRLDHDLGQGEDLRQVVVKRRRGRFAIRHAGERRLIVTGAVVVLTYLSLSSRSQKIGQEQGKSRNYSETNIPNKASETAQLHQHTPASRQP